MERMTRMFVLEGEGGLARRLEDLPYCYGLDEVTFTSPAYDLMRPSIDFAKKVLCALQLSFDEWAKRKGEDVVMLVLKENNVQPGVYDEFDICVRRAGNAAIVSLYGEIQAMLVLSSDVGKKTA